MLDRDMAKGARLESQSMGGMIFLYDSETFSVIRLDAERGHHHLL